MRNGRTFTKNAEVPAAPAANKNGNSGKQQLDAKSTLPSAATRAVVVYLAFAPFSLTCFPMACIVYYQMPCPSPCICRKGLLLKMRVRSFQIPRREQYPDACVAH